MTQAGYGPYRVETTNGALVLRYEGVKQAENHAARINKQAERMGLKTRYVVKYKG